MSKVKNVIWAALIVAILGSFAYRIFKRGLTDHRLKKDAVRIKAVIIGEKNYQPNDPVKPEWSYSYVFVVDGKRYSNDAHDPSLKVGDSVEVEYVKGRPGLNRPVHPNE